MKRIIITEQEIVDTIKSINKGAFAGITFKKADGTIRTAQAQFGVYNPANVAAPNGTGETAKQALTAGRLKFFDASVVNADGSRGGYRQALFGRVLSICHRGKLYIVDHTRVNA